MLSMRQIVAVLGGGVFGVGFSGILYAIPTFHDAGPVLLISCGAAGLGLGFIVAALVSGN